LAAYQAKLPALTELGISVVAAVVDPEDDVAAMARENGFTFPMAYGVTDTQIAAYHPEPCDDRRGHYFQPMEFLVQQDGMIAGSLYASGGVGRMDVDAVIELIRGRDRRRREAEGGDA
jgi:peroxiredoxin